MRARLSGLTARTIVVTSLLAMMAFAMILLIGQSFARLHDQVDRITGNELVRLMNSVRLIQQTESLASLGLVLVQAERHEDRRSALVELNDRVRWIGKLIGALLSESSDPEFVRTVRDAERGLAVNIAELDRLLRRRIDGSASDEELAAIRQRARENREIAGRLSVLMGYETAGIREELADQGRRLQEEVMQQRRNLAIFAALLLGAVVLSGLYFERHIVRRIRRMRHALSRGEVDPGDLRVTGKDELVDLARTMGGYVERIQAEEARMQKLHQELALLAERDPLTGLANRRHFDAAARRLLERGSGPLCLAIIDVDNFKRVNDSHGHEIGDGALVHVAAQLASALRADDVLARFGGEEFVALLPVRTARDAQRICENLRARVDGAPMLLDGGARLTLTVSIGLTMIGAPRESKAGGDAQESDPPTQQAMQQALQKTLQQALRRADGALYEAKAQGRNRILLAAVPS